ncbi:hypothetical protein ACIF8T_02965 [Streptomyces sp. NPDC085946]|uniref:hypothetical protein n=1 Tax=Streptomyces sp. NPDC085946 TaxID=3365744 RepID=UPI0037D4F1B6
MGVIDSEWWALWWPWLVVWAATAACCAVLLRYGLIRAGRLRRRRRGGRTVHGMCFFLHEQRVMDLYQQGGFSAALEQEVADRINVTSGVGLRARFGLGGGKANRDVTKERVTAYIQHSTPITVIRLLMDTMRKEDVVVHADLTTGSLEPNRALAEILRERGASDRVALTEVMSEFVSVTGRFTARSADGGDIVLRAPYGDGRPRAHVKITCEAAGVREGFQNAEYADEEEFQARCLGKVRTWNRTRGELTLDPIAIFR